MQLRQVVAPLAFLTSLSCTANRPAPAAGVTPSVTGGAPVTTAAQSPGAPAPAAQNPSPMVERTRAHGRVAPHPLETRQARVAGVLPREVELHLPSTLDHRHPVPLLVHFLGPAYLAVDAARSAHTDGANAMAVAVVNLSAGSGAYERPFRDPAAWPALLDSLSAAATRLAGQQVTFGDAYLSAFSAGNGAVRAILAQHAGRAAPRIRGILILDGIHTSYVPERRVLADSGTLDPAPLEALLRFARRAMAGEVRMVVSHSEVFPGTFASTTETANWLVERLALRRMPVLAWGPNGMQQTSEARQGSLSIIGFAGNSAPDHLDHLHALPTWLSMIVAR